MNRLPIGKSGDDKSARKKPQPTSSFRFDGPSREMLYELSSLLRQRPKEVIQLALAQLLDRRRARRVSSERPTPDGGLGVTAWIEPTGLFFGVEGDALQKLPDSEREQLLEEILTALLRSFAAKAPPAK